MCDCKKQIEAKLLEHFKASAPEAADHEIELEGYGLAVVDNTMTVRPFAPYKAAALFPLKKGGMKRNVKTGVMGFSFCPYCGEKLAGAA
jgi:hypothetical protein